MRENRESGVDWLKVILGALAIGSAYWLLSRSSSASSTAPEGALKGGASTGKPPLSPSGSFEDPDLPGHEIFTPGGGGGGSSMPNVGPNQIELKQGKTYRARLQLSGLEKLGSREQIAASFAEIGFSQVKVYMRDTELPGGTMGWPGAPNADSGARWAEGVWQRGDSVVDKPPQVVEAMAVS